MESDWLSDDSVFMELLENDSVLALSLLELT